MCCSTSFPLFALLNSAIIFMLFTLQSCVKTYSYQKWNMVFFFCSFQSANPKFIHQYHVFFVLCSISHAFANPLCFLKWFLCFDGPYIQCLFWFIHIGFFFTLFKSPLASCRSFLPCSTHTYAYTPFSNTIMNKMQWLKSKNLYNVTTDWWKLVKKSRMKWKKMSCAVTDNGEGMVEAGIGSEKFLRIRILEILKETPFFGPSS